MLLLPRPKERNSFTPENSPSKHVWHFADTSELVNFFSSGGNEEDEEDSYTPSAGVSGSVKEMLGLQRPDRQVLPVYLEEIFGERLLAIGDISLHADLVPFLLVNFVEGNAADLARALEKGIPIGRAATVELRNQHAVYAATW